MKAAKFLLCLILAIITLSFPYRAFDSGNAAAARTARYARADERDVYFCERKDLKYALFTIPYTYCVEILSTDGDWYYVKYAEDGGLYRSLYGYCLSEGLTPVDEPPENIYLYKTVPVTFKADEVVGSLPVLSEITVIAAFYGTYYSGASAYSYVLYDGGFGYIYGANDDYPLNEIPSEPVDSPEPEIPEESGNNKLVTALVLVALAAAALIIVYFTSRKARYFRPDN